MEHENEVKRVKQEYEHELIKLPGVVGVGTNPTKSIILLLESEKYLHATPNIVDGIPVKKVVVGKMRILPEMQIPNRQKVRPVVGGVSISPPENIAGTLGIITEDDVIITNAHVAAINYSTKVYEPKNTPIYQPGWLDGGGKEDKVGELLIYTNINPNTPRTVDGATCSVECEYEKMSILGIGEVEGWTIPEAGQRVMKSGRTTGVTSSTVLTNDATVNMGGYPWGSVIFKECVVTFPAIAKPGDSGSIIVTEDKNVAGMVFGGSDLATACNRMDNVIPELGIRLGRRVKSEEPNVIKEGLADVAKACLVAAAPALGVMTWDYLKQGYY